MKMRLLSVAAATAMLVLSVTAPAVHAQRSAPVAAAENGRLWFVELSGAPIADGGNRVSVQNEKAIFRRAAQAAGVRYTERRAFDTLFNGFSVEVHPRDRAKLAELPGVKAIYPVELIQAPKAERSSGGAAPDLATALSMTGADRVHSQLGFTGTGIKVGVMDTGIDVDHPDFGGSGVAQLDSPNFFGHPRIKHGYDFVGNAFNADPSSASYNPVPAPDENPDDCGGHGTHVAGIVGANGTVKGVAPGVTFGAYRVFGCAGSTTADIMIAAMEKALADGMHVLNMSIGSAYQWPQYPTAAAASRLVNKGMVVVASIGNSGANGIYSAGAPGLGEKVIGVASFDNTNMFVTKALLNGTLTVPYTTLTSAPPTPTSGTTAPIAFAGRGCNADAPLADVGGKVALLTRGVCSFAEKYLKARAAGATGVIIENNAPGDFFGTLGNPSPAFTIFGIGVSQATGAAIKAAGAGATLTWTADMVNVTNPNGNLISSFSSYGLSPDLALKPDIGAPGGFIYSTYPLEAGAYATLSGTSMSSPHVAGAAALLLQAQPRTPAQAVRGILQNSADPKAWWGSPAAGFLDNVHRQGAGMLDIDDAILATTRIEPAKIAAGEGEAGPVTRTLTIENKSLSPVTYILSSVNALSTGANSFTPGFSPSNASVAFSAGSVTVPARSSATIDVTITPASAPAGGQYGGYVVLTDAAAPGKVFRVPFAGYIGDYQARQVLVPTANNFPRLGWTPDGVNFGFAGAGDVFTMAEGDIPYVLAHLDHQSRRLRIEVFDAVTGQSWHRVSNDEYLPRNSTAAGFFAFAWDGTTFAGNGKNPNQWRTAPNGKYVLKVSVLKALGDEGNPAHWETWTSPMFEIKRP